MNCIISIIINNILRNNRVSNCFAYTSHFCPENIYALGSRKEFWNLSICSLEHDLTMHLTNLGMNELFKGWMKFVLVASPQKEKRKI